MTMHKKNFAKPDEVMTPPHMRVERITVGDRTIVKQVFEPGWQWSKFARPPGGPKSCQIHHFGVQLTGRMHVKHDDGQEIDYGPGDVWDIPPGHDGWVVGDEAVVYYGFFQDAKK
jgi:hypothetical protein